jgi:hypothetical protein
VWVGRAYLDLDPFAWPVGREFGMALQSHFVWPLLPRCGPCMLWNGFVNGGAPALAELHGAPFHPVVAITSLVWGAINGIKITLVISLAMAGLAQWWLARVLGLGTVPRLWGAGLAVVGGHLAGRMDAGLFPLVLSTAAVSLVIPAGLELALTGRRRSAVRLGAALALALVAGQGYLQLGLALSILPAFLVFLLNDGLRAHLLWKRFLWAGLLALLLSAVFWVPLAHFSPHIYKDTDPDFTSAQPVQYAPLNLVINDVEFYRSEALGKGPYPFLYVNYIGWIPVLLAFLSLRLIPRDRRRILLFFAIALALVYLANSAITLKLLKWLLGPLSGPVTGVRCAPLMGGLAVPLVLGLAAWGLDHLLKLDWPRLTLTVSPGPVLRLGTRWPVMTILLLGSLKPAYDLSRVWLRTELVSPEVYPVVQMLRTQATQWVRPPFGELFWSPAALEAGLKLTESVRPWNWKDREIPRPFLVGEREDVARTGPEVLGRIDGVDIVVRAENQYAVVETDATTTACRATAIGGNIDVDCETDEPGALVVRENQWSGWTAKRDGVAVPLDPGPWLTVKAPAGLHHYEFRYRPWDVTVGLLLTIAGVALSIVACRTEHVQ